MKTISITGGGLAGLSLGIALRGRGVPVLLSESGQYPRHRVCGEFISGVHDDTLESLGILNCLDEARILSTTSWYVGGEKVCGKRLPRPARGLSRWDLDACLARKFEDLGGELVTGNRIRRKNAASEGSVWAAGREPSGTGRKWIGLKVHCRNIFLVSDLELHLGTRGYAGISPVGDGIVNLCGLFYSDPSLEGKNSELLVTYLSANGLSGLVNRIHKGRVLEESFCAVAGMDYGIFKKPSSGFVLGDSWNLIPPFTGNGMSMAFETAFHAVGPLSRWAEGRCDWETSLRNYREVLRRHLAPRVRRARLLQSLLLTPASRIFLAWLARRDFLPFHTLYSLTH